MDFAQLDIASVDYVLTTTRAVRRRLDTARSVSLEVIHECLDLALQAPTGGNAQGWRWVVVTDAGQRERIALIYRELAQIHLSAAKEAATEPGAKRAYETAIDLAARLHLVPALVLAFVEDVSSRDQPPSAGLYASVLPAVWSLQLALRSRGLGSTLTTLLTLREDDVVRVLGVPAEHRLVAMLPVGYTKGTQFRRAVRVPVEAVTHLDTWGGPFVTGHRTGGGAKDEW